MKPPPARRFFGHLAAVAAALEAVCSACGSSKPASGSAVLQVRVVVKSQPGTCPSSSPSPKPTETITLADPSGPVCDELGPAGLVIDRAAASVESGLPLPTV